MTPMKIFTVHDAKASYYLQPFFGRANGEAIRSFSEAINSPDHQFAKHHADFTLFELGSYDESTGLITPLPQPVSLGNGVDFKIQQ